MKIQLPEAGLTFLKNFFQSPSAGLFLLFLLFGYLLVKRERRPLLKRAAALDLSGWSLVLVMCLWLVLDIIAGMVGWVGPNLVYIFFRDLIVFLSIYGCYVSTSAGEQSARDIFGRLRPPGKLILLGAGTFLLLGIVFWLISFSFPFVVNLRAGRLNMFYIAQGVLVCVFIPLLEELIFRSYLYRLIRRHTGRWVAVVSVAAVFALLHGGGVELLFIFSGGILMTILFEFTGSIIPGLVLHAGFNFLINWGYLWL